MGVESVSKSHRKMELIRLLRERGQSVFGTVDAQDIAREIGIAPSYLKIVLRELRERGWIQRIKRGTYAITAGLSGFSLDSNSFSMGMALVDPCAISGWAALNYHEFTDQIPQITELTTSKKITTPAMRGKAANPASAWHVNKHTFEIVSIIPAHFFGYDYIWINEVRVRIFDRERTLLDCFAMPRRFGGISEGLGIVEQCLDQFDIERLIRYAIRYGKDAVSRRVGYALEIAGADVELLRPLQEKSGKGYRLLDPTKPQQGKYAKKWGLLNNLHPGCNS